MSSPPAPVRSEAFFQNETTANDLRTRTKISRALGVVGVSKSCVEEIIDSALEIWDREGPVNFHQNRNSPEFHERRDAAIAELRAQYASVFDMPCGGPAEERFVHERAPFAIITLVNRELINIQKARGVNTDANANGPGGSEGLVKIFSATQQEVLLTLKTESVIPAGDNAPSFSELEGKLMLATRSPLKVWPGLSLVFVQVEADGTTTHIHNQVDLRRVFGIWRQQHLATDVFSLYALDNEGAEPDLSLQLPPLL